MNERAIIADRIQKKETEIQLLEEKIRATKIYIQALQDILRTLDRSVTSPPSVDSSPKTGSAVSRAREIIMAAGKPVHINDLLAGMGREVTRETRASVNGSLAAYVRKGEIFSRPAPNTYGLLELGHVSTASDEPEPPAYFGAETAPDDDEIPF